MRAPKARAKILRYFPREQHMTSSFQIPGGGGNCPRLPPSGRLRVDKTVLAFYSLALWIYESKLKMWIHYENTSWVGKNSICCKKSNFCTSLFFCKHYMAILNTSKCCITIVLVLCCTHFKLSATAGALC